MKQPFTESLIFLLNQVAKSASDPVIHGQAIRLVGLIEEFEAAHPDVYTEPDEDDPDQDDPPTFDLVPAVVEPEPDLKSMVATVGAGA